MKNYEAARKLVKRYESITLKEINKAFEDNPRSIYLIPSILTGIGSYATCILCQAADVYSSYGLGNCINCIYGYRLACVSFPNILTYDAIFTATTPKELLLAYRNRAKHIRGIFIKDGINFKTLKPIK